MSKPNPDSEAFLAALRSQDPTTLDDIATLLRGIKRELWFIGAALFVIIGILLAMK